ncbi:MAG: Spy/CpxP family protein refolding chaperone [Caulobacter sp.]|nr:Spy/CpxP family protein refolding chaperone [Caulobacter sp.]
MSMPFKSLLFVAAFGLATSAYAAEQPAPPHVHGPAVDPTTAPAAPAAPAAKGGMMAMGGKMDMGAMHCMGLSEQRLSGLKTELNINDRQTKVWNAFAAAAGSDAHAKPAGMTMPMKAGAKPGMMGDDGMMAKMKSKPLPERLAHHETMMKAHLKALHKVRMAVSGLYRVLTPEQRTMADKSLCGGMAR